MRSILSCLLLSFLLLSTASFSQEHESDGPEHIQERQAWFNKGRRAPDGTSGAPLLNRGYQQKTAKRIEEAKRAMAAPATQPIFGTSWTAMGPGPFKSNATGSQDAYDYGYVSGRVTTVVVDQADTTGNTVYVGTANGGIWKSTNAANATASTVAWKALTDQQVSLAIGSLAIQPGNRNLILAGTGEANFSGDSYYAQGFLRSTDGGSTWSAITSGSGVSFLGVAIGAIAFDPDHPNVVVAGIGYSDKGDVDGVDSILDSRFEIWYSSDAGLTWSQASFLDGSATAESWSVNSIIWNPYEHSFYAAVGFHGVYSSTDGITWHRLATQPGTQLSQTNCPSETTSNCPFLRGALAMRPSANDMYIWYVDNNQNDEGIYRSVNGGSTWTALSTKGIDTCGDSDGCGTAQGSYNLELAAVGTSTGVDLYAGAINLYKCSITSANSTCSVNPFLNLTHVYGCSPVASTAHVHPDQHGIDFAHSSPNVMYFGNDGGMYRTLTASGLTNGTCTGTNPFQNLNQGFGSVTEFVYLSGHPTDPTVFLGGTQDNGSPATDSTHDGASQTSWITVNGGDGGYNAINPKNPNEWFTSHTGMSIARCTSGINCTDSTFTTIVTNKNLGNDVSEFYPPFMLDPAVSGVMLAGTCRLWRGPTTTATGWTAISPPISSTTYCDPNTTTATITSIAAGGPAGAKGSQVLWVGYTDSTAAVISGVDSGGGWEPISGMNAYPVTSVVVDPTDKSGRTGYITISGFQDRHVFKFASATSQLTDLSGDLPNVPVNTIAPDPENPSLLYVGTDVGVFYADNGGQHWTEVAPGTMPNVVVTHLQLYEYNQVKKLRAATYGRGVWEIPLYWNNAPQGYIDSVRSKAGSATVSQSETLTVTGWAADIEDGSPVSSVQILLDGQSIGSATTGLSRPDVAKDFNRAAWTNSGWTFASLISGSVTPGSHQLVAVALDSENFAKTIGTVTLTVLANKPPQGGLDSVVNPANGTATVPQNGSLLIRGWAADNEDGAPVSVVDVSMNPTYYAVGATLGLSRPDIATKFNRPDWTNSGFQATWLMSTPTVTFVPGTYKVMASATDSYGASAMLDQTFTVTVTASPVLVFGSSGLNFGNQGLHNLQQSLAVSIANHGAASAQISTVSVPPGFKESTNCIGTLAAQKSCNVTVTFIPTAAETYSGSLGITASDSATPHTIPLTGTGVPDTLQTPAIVNFGDAKFVTNSAPQTFTLTNISTHTIKFTSSIGAIYTGIVGGTCVMPGSLAAGASCTVEMTAVPYNLGWSNFDLAVSTDQPDSPRYIPAKVYGLGAEFSVKPDTLVFPTTKIGTSSQGTMTLTNTGDIDLHISSVGIKTDPSWAMNSNCSTVAAGSTCAINLTFSPKLPTSMTETVAIDSDAIGGRLDEFEAEGVGTGTALLLPPYLEFAAVAVNTNTSATIKVYNPSSSGIDIKTVSTAAPFSATNKCVNPIAAGATCGIVVSFKDASVGRFTGTLTITTDDDLGSYTIPLTGVTN